MSADWTLEGVNVEAVGEAKRLLADVTAVFPAGSVTLITGPNGAGKTTLLETMAGLRLPLSGAIRLGGQPLWESRRKLNRAALLQFGISMQHAESQWFASSVQDEMSYSLRPYRIDGIEAARRMSAALEQAGLSESLLDRDPWSLSGGQQRRLALACLLACEPEWLLLDEPTAGLDAAGIRSLRWTLEARKKAGKGAIVVTHDAEALLPLADRVIVVREGKAHTAPLSVLSRLTSGARTAELLREAALLPPASAPDETDGFEGPASDSPEEAAALGSPKLLAAALASSLQIRRDGAPDRTTEPSPRSGHPQEEAAAASETSRRRTLFRSDRFDPRVVIFSYLLLSTMLLMLQSLTQLAWASLVAIALVTPVWRLIRPWLGVVKGFVGIIVVFTVIGGIGLTPLSFHWEQAEPGALRLLQLLLVMLLGMPLMGLMTPLRLQRAIQQTFGWTAAVGVPIHGIGLLITLIFRFIPLLLKEWKRYAKLAHARGKALTKPGSIPLRMLRSVMLPYLRSILRLGDAMSDALEARGYAQMPRKPVYAFRLRPGKADALLLVAALAGSALLWLIIRS